MHQSNHIFRCPHCNNNIIDEDGNETVIRSRLLKMRKPNNDATVLCSRCKRQVPIPLKITMN